MYNEVNIIVETIREQRSPQFGLLGGYSDYNDYNDAYFRYGNGRKYHHHKHHRPHGLIGGYGCRGYGCGGGYVEYYYLSSAKNKTKIKIAVICKCDNSNYFIIHKNYFIVQ